MSLRNCLSSLQFHHHNSGRGIVGASLSSASNSNLIHFPRRSLQQQQQLLLSKEEVDCSRHSRSLSEVRRIFHEAKDGAELMTAIDRVQKLDIGYHFTEEIEAAMEFLYRNRREIVDGETDMFLQITTLFRLLRQARYPVSSGKFFYIICFIVADLSIVNGRISLVR